MSDEAEKQQRREDCRREVLRYLANRSVLAFSAATVRNALHREFNFTVEEVTAALKFLHGLKFIAIESHEMGATLFHRITSEGILHNERTP
jgi:hypothetical protein